MDELADWAVRLMDVLAVDTGVYRRAIRWAARSRCRWRGVTRSGSAGLILLGPTTGDSQVPFWRYALGLLLDGFGESLVYNLKLLRMYSQMGLRRYLATVRHMMHDDPLAHAGEVRAPCLVTRGGNDRIVPEPTRRNWRRCCRMASTRRWTTRPTRRNTTRRSCSFRRCWSSSGGWR